MADVTEIDPGDRKEAGGGTWFPLTGDARIMNYCATEGCPGQPAFRLEAEGIGSDYCSGCASKIRVATASEPGV